MQPSFRKEERRLGTLPWYHKELPRTKVQTETQTRLVGFVSIGASEGRSQNLYRWSKPWNLTHQSWKYMTLIDQGISNSTSRINNTSPRGHIFKSVGGLTMENRLSTNSASRGKSGLYFKKHHGWIWTNTLMVPHKIH